MSDDAALQPDLAVIERHLFELFSPAFVHPHPDTWIEIAYGHAATGGHPNAAEHFSVFNLQQAVAFAVSKNKGGFNIYVGVALRRGETAVQSRGRANGSHVVTAAFGWREFDQEGDLDRVNAILKEKKLQPAMVVETGRAPHPRFHPYFRLQGNVTPDQLRDANNALDTLLGGDAVANPDRLMRLAGTVNYPTEQKQQRGYVTELVKLNIHSSASAYTVEQLLALAGRPRQRAMSAMPDYLVELCKADHGKGTSFSLNDWYGPTSPEKIQSALSLINPDIKRSAWFAIGCALYAELGNDGFAIWNNWSKKGVKYQGAEMAAQWHSMVKADGYSYTAATIFMYANLVGWSWRDQNISGQFQQSDAGGDDPTTTSRPGAVPPATPPDPTMFELHWHGDKSDRPIREWLVKDLIFKNGTGLLSGQWGMAKTFGGLDLAASVMTSTKFAGREVNRQGGVLFIAAEGQNEMRPRLKGLVEQKLRPLAEIGEQAGCPMATDLNRLPFAWIEEIPNLQDNVSFRKLMQTAKHMDQIIGEQFNLPLVLIIIDTISVVGNFKDADDTAENQLVMNRLSTLGRETDAFVLAVDHFGKAVETGTRNSSAKEGHADVVLALLGERAINGVISNTRMALRKQRGGKTGIEFPFDLKIVDIDEGETTCIVQWRTEQSGVGQAPANDRWIQSLRVFKTALEAALTQHGRMIAVGRGTARAVSNDDARRGFMAIWPADDRDAKRKAYNRALKMARERHLVQSLEVNGVDFLWLPEERERDQDPPIAEEEVPFSFFAWANWTAIRPWRTNVRMSAASAERTDMPYPYGDGMSGRRMAGPAGAFWIKGRADMADMADKCPGWPGCPGWPVRTCFRPRR